MSNHLRILVLNAIFLFLPDQEMISICKVQIRFGHRMRALKKSSFNPHTFMRTGDTGVLTINNHLN